MTTAKSLSPVVAVGRSPPLQGCSAGFEAFTSSSGSGLPHPGALAVGGHGRNAKLQLSAVLASERPVDGLYGHPERRPRRGAQGRGI